MNKTIFIKQLVKMSSSGFTSKILLKRMDSFLYKSIVEDDTLNLEEVKMKKYYFISSMLHSAARNIKNGTISSHSIEKLAEVMIENSFFKETPKIDNARKKFVKDNDFLPPSFITLSPTQACNLKKCTGCYASCDKNISKSLPWDVINKIVSDVHDLFGARFITISGGEPLLYKNNGHTLLDLFGKYNDMFFLVYTNGTLITREYAHELARLGNVTPAISVEGFEKETDERRGKGVYKKILQAFNNLCHAGVPFGISVTATSRNTELLLSEKFYQQYFDVLGATYMWEFQFLPIGSGIGSFDLVVDPDNRIKLYKMWEEQMSIRKRCIADFWNSGVLTCGCIAYGGNHGYFHIDWNGNIMPCVFVPYYVDNVIDLYRNNKNLVDALNSEFMKRGRKWQNDYGLSHHKTAENWLMPCSFRDHYKNFMQNILTPQVKAMNPEAQQILYDPDYYKKMLEYDKELTELTYPIWQSEYLEKESDNNIQNRAKIPERQARVT